MFPESHGIVAMPFTSCIEDTCMFRLFIPIKLVKGDEIVLACDRYNNETVTFMKHVTKYKNMRKWMVEFLRKSDSRDNKIARVKSPKKKYNLF